MLRCASVFERFDLTKFITGKSVTVFAMAFFFVFGVVEPAAAQDAMLQQMATTAGFGGASLPIIVARLIRTFISITGIIAVVVVIYAGWLYMTAGGDADKVNRAKRMLTQGAIGLFLVFASFSITQFVLNRLLGATQPTAQVTSTSATDLYSEPFSASLGAGVIDDHYPPRNAIDIPRNTNIFITFKQPLNPDSIIDGYSQDPDNETSLNSDNVLIYPTGQGEAAALGTDDVVVSMNNDQTIFTFNPVDLMGSANEDMNYTVALQPDIQLDNGEDAFQDIGADGYQWTFEVSTEVDWTPPVVNSVQPSAGNTYPRNTAIEVTFNEAMNPVAATGVLDDTNPTDDNFNNIEVRTGAAPGSPQNGTFEIGNNYKTVTYLSDNQCAEDPCGNPVFCLPGGETVRVWAHSATLSNDPPQAALTQGLYNGLVDAAGNALDGNENYDSDDPANTMEGRGDDQNVRDDYRWMFDTSTNLDTRVPTITGMSPGIDGANVGQDQPVEITFSMPMMGSSLDSSSSQLWPAPWYEFWWTVGKVDLDDNGNPVAVSGNATDHSQLVMNHPTFIPPEEQAWDYYPLVNEQVKGINQFCMYPSRGPGCSNLDDSTPYCCNGTPSSQECETIQRTIVDDQGASQSVPEIQLPDTSQ